MSLLFSAYQNFNDHKILLSKASLEFPQDLQFLKKLFYFIFTRVECTFLNLFPALAKQRINKYEFCKKHVEKTINETKGISKSDESQTAWQRELTPDVR